MCALLGQTVKYDGFPEKGKKKRCGMWELLTVHRWSQIYTLGNIF